MVLLTSKLLSAVPIPDSMTVPVVKTVMTILIGEFHAWDNCTSIGISVIFYPCKQITLY